MEENIGPVEAAIGLLGTKFCGLVLESFPINSYKHL
jgi:hypothetical protein